MLLLAVGMLHQGMIRRRSIKIMLFPGMIVDGVLRAISCLLSATPITRVSFLGGDRPLLETGKSLLGPLGACVNVVVRCSLLLVAGFILLTYFPDFLNSRFALPLIDEETIETGVLAWHSFPDFWEQLQRLPQQLTVQSLASALLLYTFMTTLFFAGMQHREFVWIGAAWLAALCLGVAGGWLGITFGFFSRGWFIQILYVPQMWSAFSLVVLATACVAGIVATARGCALLVSPLRKKPDA